MNIQNIKEKTNLNKNIKIMSKVGLKEKKCKKRKLKFTPIRGVKKMTKKLLEINKKKKNEIVNERNYKVIRDYYENASDEIKKIIYEDIKNGISKKILLDRINNNFYGKEKPIRKKTTDFIYSTFKAICFVCSCFKAICIVCLCVALGIATGSSLKFFLNRDDAEVLDGSAEVIVGYNDFDPSLLNKALNLVGMGTSEGEFAILDIKKVDDNGLIDKIEAANEKGIEVGLNIILKSLEIEDAHKMCEYVEVIVSNYSVDYPIILDLEPICCDDSKTPCDKGTLINKIQKNFEEQGMYFVVKGNEKELETARQYLNAIGVADITYDECVLIDNKEDVEFNKYEFYMDKDGKIVTRKNYENIIEKNDLNNPEKIKGNLIVILGEGETIREVAEKYNMSENDLRKVNGFRNNEKVEPGTKIVIPFEPSNNSKSQSYEYKFNENASIAYGNTNDNTNNNVKKLTR